MAEGYQSIPKDGWTNSEILHTETYGQLYGRLNPQIGLAQLIWKGNEECAPNSNVEWSIPSKYNPPWPGPVNKLANTTNNSFIEVRAGENKVRMGFRGENWLNGIIIYAI